MSTKYLNALKDIADQLGLTLHKKMQVIYGKTNGYSVQLIPIKDTQQFRLKLSLLQKNEPPHPELVKQVVSESKVVKNCHVHGHQVDYLLKAGRITKRTTGEKLRETVKIITQFLKAAKVVSCCQDCGTKGSERFYNVAGIPTLCCPNCFKNHQDAIAADEQAEAEKKDHFVPGLIGALLGSLVGVATIILFGQLGFVSALSGLLMAICSIKGYELMGGKLTKKGMITTGIIMMVMVYFGTRLDWAISLASVIPDTSFFTTFWRFSDLMSEGIVEASDFYYDLTVVYQFAAIGAIPTLIAMRKDKKTVTESYSMRA